MKLNDAQTKVKNLLRQEWRGYQNLIKAARKKPSTDKIHRLRVQVHKLSAAYELAMCLREYPKSQKFIKHMKLTQKKTNALRDLQVELLFLKRHRNSEASSLAKYLQKHKAKIARRTQHFLHHINLGKQKYFIEKMEENLVTPKLGETSSSIEIQIKSCVRHAFIEFEDRQQLVLESKHVDLHKFRTMAKHLRYLTEAEKALTGTTDMELAHVKNVQVFLGRTQDDSVFIKNIDDYLEKRLHHKDKGVKILRAMISRQHNELLKSASKYVKVAREN